MRLLLVRHGHPNYELDCLTPLGRLQAEAAAKRLKNENIDLFFSSTCGRAVETAAFAAKEYGLPVTRLEFMREVVWGCGDEICGPAGHPWNQVDQMILDGKALQNPDWRETPPFQGNLVTENADRIARDFDAWMETLGYTRRGTITAAAITPVILWPCSATADPPMRYWPTS